ncbi:proprotein convertase subtilisin/kexin type 5 [Drosophila novamexicana]|uniref:proprotein convertase subtilisin/kexin type 5 n=1 Tax=Drosophila novamexicana TaxID=47314 RepID=UPI0011E5C0F1|nr:proprotein convertase subtilisin/kexin type 5 [Drosophila novamexicana]
MYLARLKIRHQYVLLICLLFWLSAESLASSCCKEGETQEDPIDCLSYYVCCSGVFVHKTCGSGNYWNSTVESCQPNNGQCCPGAGECTENELHVDPQDCAAYYLCVMGQFVRQKCASGAYFDTTIKACVVDTEGYHLLIAMALVIGALADDCCQSGDTKADEDDCTKYYACCTGQFVHKSCPSGEYWNSQSASCETDNGQCVPCTCTEGETQSDPEDCTKYLICKNGEFVSASCDSGDYWNSDSDKCEKDNGQCIPCTCTEGETQSDPEDCTKYLICKNGAFVSASCDSGDYWNSQSGKCEKDNGQCIPCTCTEGETQSDSTDCTKYLICKNGAFVSASCDSGDYWNSQIGKCEKDNGQCVPQTCTDGETKANPTDCTKYQVCKDGVFVSASCDSGDYWNSDSGKCEKDNGQCVPTTCTDGEIEVNPADCAGYFECVGGTMVRRKCASQTYFDTNLKACVIDTEGVCIPKVCDPECCDVPNDWIGPVDKNCSAFIYCLYGHMILQTCPNNLQFNNLTKQCDYPDVVQCDDGSPPPSGPTAGPSGTYCESGGRCVGQRDGTMFAVDNSGGYIVCQCECEINFTCSPGLVFNEQIRSCDWPAKR